MFLLTRVTNRRQFLERTALGAGSVLFLPGLLTSCADHRIPDPNAPGTPGVTPPVIVGDDPIDWNDDAKSVVTGLLSAIPEVGGILSGLVSIFWPGTDVWSQVRDQVEALIEQKLDDFEFSTAQGLLTGLQNNLTTYMQEIKDGATGQKMYDNWTTTIGLLNKTVPQFALSGYEILLLPFYAQIANMRLATQRDMVIAGKSWGRSEAEQATDIQNLKNYIFEHIQHVETVYTLHSISLGVNTPVDYDQVEPFTAVNKYTRETTRTVLDYAQFWPYYDVTKYPQGAKVSLPRELYSDPRGSQGRLGGPISLPKPPTQSPTSLTVWGSTDGVDAVQLTYPAGSGPNGVTTTPRMGRQDGGGCGIPGTTDQPYGRILPLSPTNPLFQARTARYYARADCSAINENYKYIGLGMMQFKLLDGTVINKVGADGNLDDEDWVGITDHFISSIYINGSIEDYNGIPSIADCVVFGFKYLDGKPSVTSRTLERLYITNPRELSGADLAQASPTNGTAATVITSNLKAARQAYWAANKARANAPK